MTAAELDSMVRAARSTLARSIGTRAGIAHVRIAQHAERIREARDISFARAPRLRLQDGSTHE